MGFKKVCKNAWGIFVVTVRGLWLVFILLIIIPSILIHYSFKRIYIKGKIRRRLRNDGMPPEIARRFAKKYSNFLVDYGSARGIFRLSRSAIKSDKEIEDEDNSSLEIKPPKSYSFVF